MNYAGRPGISPGLAALIALGEVRPEHRILDIGCANGTDVLTLARWGFREVVGVDPDAKAIGSARSRATRAKLAQKARFHAIGAEKLSTLFRPRTFDVALHTLVANNLTQDHAIHFQEIARVLKPDGVLLLHERVTRGMQDATPGKLRPVAGAARHFDLGQGIPTHLAEHPTERRGPTYARVILWVGRPKA